jgi:WD40 repeat protein
VGWVDASVKGTQPLNVFDPLTGETIVTGDTSHEVLSGLAPLDVVWSTDGQQLVAFIGEAAPIENGSRVVEIVQVWDAKTGQRVRSFPVTQPEISREYGSNLYTVTVRSRALCHRYLAAAKIKAVNLNGLQSLSPFLEVWDIGKGNIIFTQDIQTGNMQWAPDRRRLALLTADRYKNARWEIWDIPTGQRLRSFPLTVNPSLSTLVWSPDGQSIAFGPDIYSVETGRKVMTYHVAGEQLLEVMAWSPDEKRVAVRSARYLGGGPFTRTSHPLFVLDASSSRKLTQYDSTNGSFIWSPNGAYFLILEKSLETIEVWRMP